MPQGLRAFFVVVFLDGWPSDRRRLPAFASEAGFRRNNGGLNPSPSTISCRTLDSIVVSGKFFALSLGFGITQLFFNNLNVANIKMFLSSSRLGRFPFKETTPVRVQSGIPTTSL
jgi:hypothetical protein